MLKTPHPADRRTPTASPIMARTGTEQATASPARHRPFQRVTMGFWLGGFCLGMGGSILGGFMPYHHPVAVAISMLWWGIYFGCFGASIGALLGMWLKCRQPGAALNAIAPVVGASLVVHNGENGNSRRIHPIQQIVGETANCSSLHVPSQDRTYLGTP